MGAPVQTCLGCCSVLVVVAVAATVQTLLGNAPLVFLQQAEAALGQADVVLRPSPSAPGLGTTLNYTAIAERLDSAARAADAQGQGVAGWASELRSHVPRLDVFATLRRLDDCDVRWAAAGSTCGSFAPAAAGNAWMYRRPQWPHPFSSNGTAPRGDCGGAGLSSCLPDRCGLRLDPGTGSWGPAPATSGELTVLDMALAAAAGLGRDLTDAGRPGPGEVTIGPAVAQDLGISAADVSSGSVWLAADIRWPSVLRWAFADLGPTGDAPPGNWSQVALGASTAVPLRVRAVLAGGAGGLLPSPRDWFVLADAASLGAWAAPRLPPALRCEGSDAGGAACPLASGAAAGGAVRSLCRGPAPPAAGSAPPDGAGPVAPASAVRAAATPRLRDVADSVVVMLPPASRGRTYADGDVDSLQAAVAAIAGRVVYATGLSSLVVGLPLLEAVSEQRFVALYLSLVLSICLVVLFALAAMVVYSILTVSVSARRFEIGVRRMLGATQPSLVALLLAQALVYAVPGWAIGLALAALASGQLTAQLAVSTSGAAGEGGAVAGAEVLSAGAVVAATALALAVPAVAAVGPIRAALSTSIREGLDAGGGRGGQGGSKATEHVVERAGTGRPSGPLLALGLLGFGAGLALYYLLPLALLSLDLGLFLALFLCVFVGMLGGAAVLALNAQGLLQRALACLCIAWWERGAVVRVAVANLGAHARRNRLTSLMYTLAVAFVVFVATVAQQQLQASVYEAFAEAGTVVYAAASDSGRGDSSASGAVNVARGPAAGAGLLPRPGASGPGVSSYRGADSDATFAAPWRAPAPSSAAESVAASDPSVGAAESVVASLGLTWSWSYRPLSEWGSPRVAAWAAAHGPAAYAPSAPSSLSSPAAAAAGPEALDPGSRPAPLFTVLSPLGRTATAQLEVVPVGPGLFAQYDDGYAVLSDADAGSPDASPVAPGTPSMSAGEIARSRGSPRPPGLGSSAAARGALSVSEALASAWASGGVAGSGGLSTAMRFAPGSPALLGTSDAAASPQVRRSRQRLVAMLNAAPWLWVRRTSAGRDALSSPHAAAAVAAARGAGRPAGLVEPARLHPRTAGMTAGGIDRLRNALAAQPVGPGWAVVDVRSEVSDLGAALAALDLVFAGLTASAMVLCFFSLTSAMSTNVLEQAREIGVMLALGLRGRALVRAYVHEATLLVGSASLSGLLIGVASAWTFGQQRALFTSQSVPLPVPWALVGVVLVLSAACGILAAFAPAMRLVKRPITNLMRSL